MKKLFGKGKKPEGDRGALWGKTVQVGHHEVRVEELVGEGGYACIYRVRDADSKPYALKHLRLQADPDHIQEVQREAKTMVRLRGHPSILRLYAVAFAGQKGAETDGFFLMDFCPGTLIEYMRRGELHDHAVLDIFTSVCNGVAHMHSQNPPLAHRDLKAENVLQLGDKQWVLCDFGSATTRAKVYETAAEMAEEEDNIRRHTTPAYRAPEMWDLYNRQLIDTKVDIWALGVMLFVLAFGKLPFPGDSKLQILYGRYEMPPNSNRSPALRSLIGHLLVVNPDERPDIHVVLSMLEDVKARLSMAAPTPAPDTNRSASASSMQQPPQQDASPRPDESGHSYSLRAHSSMDRAPTHDATPLVADARPAAASLTDSGPLAEGPMTAHRTRVSRRQEPPAAYAAASASGESQAIAREHSTPGSEHAAARSSGGGSFWPPASQQFEPSQSVPSSEGEDWANFGQMSSNGVSSPKAQQHQQRQGERPLERRLSNRERRASREDSGRHGSRHGSAHSGEHAGAGSRTQRHAVEESSKPTAAASPLKDGPKRVGSSQAARDVPQAAAVPPSSYPTLPQPSANSDGAVVEMLQREVAHLRVLLLEEVHESRRQIQALAEANQALVARLEQLERGAQSRHGGSSPPQKVLKAHPLSQDDTRASPTSPVPRDASFKVEPNSQAPVQRQQPQQQPPPRAPPASTGADDAADRGSFWSAFRSDGPAGSALSAGEAPLADNALTAPTEALPSAHNPRQDDV